MVSRANVGPSSLRFPGREAPAGFTLVEIMMVVAIISLLASMAVYSLLRARMTANESAVIANQRALVSTLEMYRANHVGYPENWQAQLYDDAEPDYGPLPFNLDMEESPLQGYLHTYAVQPDGCSEDCSGYTISSTPQTPGLTGSRAFFVNQTGVIRHCLGEGPADVTDEPMHLAPTHCN